jgi:hypothetical protein
MNKIELKKIEDLNLLESNPRNISKKDFDKLKQSITEDKEFLYSRPILCYLENNKLVIYAGNQRYRACKELGIKEVPVIVDYNASSEIIKKRILLDNIEFGKWDFDILANHWEIDELEFFKGLDTNLDIKLNDLIIDDIDFDNIKSNEDREKKSKIQTVTCPDCNCKFEMQI